MAPTLRPEIFEPARDLSAGPERGARLEALLLGLVLLGSGFRLGSRTSGGRAGEVFSCVSPKGAFGLRALGASWFESGWGLRGLFIHSLKLAWNDSPIHPPFNSVQRGSFS
jgi:hypothetical protein